MTLLVALGGDDRPGSVTFELLLVELTVTPAADELDVPLLDAVVLLLVVRLAYASSALY